MKYKTIYSILIAGLLAISVQVSAAVIPLEATLNEAQANAGAGTGSPGLGEATMTFDDATNLLSWAIVWDGLLAPVFAAHFHGPALPNQNAAVQVGIDPVSPSIGFAVIDDAQSADLLAGLWYINVHTAAFPGGEIRGNVQVGDAGNDMCEDSSGPLVVDSVTTGTTSTATPDEPPDIDCGTDVTAPGVWYNVTGTGNTMTASACNDGNPATGGAGYDTKISVYCADCENLDCIGGEDDTPGCDGFSTQFSWPTKAGHSYQVLVHGFADATGDFALAILDDGEPSTGASDCDGVPDDFDICLGTEIPEAVPTVELGVNRWALVDGDGVFDTTLPPGGGNGPGLGFDIEDTAGCSCEQIIDQFDLGAGHSKFGCSISAMEDWMSFLDEQSCGNCVEDHGGLGCEVSECEATVCSIDPFCCDVAWDGFCAVEAVELCSPDICLALLPGAGD